MAAVVNVCVDPRLDHPSLRAQIKARLMGLRLPDDRVIITNEVGGNLGSAFRDTITLLREHLREQVVLAAVLYHDDCLAEPAGLRKPLSATAQEVETLLTRQGVRCPVLTGTIRTEDSLIRWSDGEVQSSEVLTFRMPRMFG